MKNILVSLFLIFGCLSLDAYAETKKYQFDISDEITEIITISDKVKQSENIVNITDYITFQGKDKKILMSLDFKFIGIEENKLKILFKNEILTFPIDKDNSGKINLKLTETVELILEVKYSESQLYVKYNGDLPEYKENQN